MPTINESVLISILNNYESEARNLLNSRIRDDNEVTRRYQAQPYGDEIDGRSQVVSEDVKDVVESDMPPLIRTIVNSGPICVFTATDPENEMDVKEASEKTEFADWVVRGQVDSYKINYDFIKTVDMYRCAALKYMLIDEEKEIKETFEINSDGLLELDQKISLTPHFVRYEITSEKEMENGRVEYKVKIFTHKQEIKIIPVPNETLLISAGATSTEDAGMIGDESIITRGELVADGYDEDLVRRLPESRGNPEGETTREMRFNRDGQTSPGDYGEWANQTVKIIDMYPLVDYEMSGKLERRHIIKSGDFILLDEPFGHSPYTICSALMTPYSAIGNGRAEQVLNINRVKTSLERGQLDNLWIHNNPETHINDNVNRDDQMSDDIGKVVRHKGDLPPANNVFSHNIDFIGDKAAFGIQYQDQKKAKLVGNQLTSQGLNADDINNETATRFKGVEKAEAAKLELVVRNIAEVGYKKLYQGVIWLAQKFMSNEVVINKKGKSLRIDPSKWNFEHDLKVQIGLGTGNNEETVANLTGLWNIHSQLKAEQSPLTDEVKRYNVLDDLVKALEMPDTARYFNNPDEPSEMLMAQNEYLNQLVLQQQQMLEAMQIQIDNPLVKAEEINAQKDLIETQANIQQDKEELAEKARQFNIQTAQKAKQHDDEVALKVTKLEIESSKDLPGGLN